MFQRSTFRLPSNRSITNLSILLFLSLLVSGFSYSQNADLPKVADVNNLELGKPIERELSSQEKHSYQINLLANQYTKITVEQKGVDVLAHLSDGEGKALGDFDADMRPNGIENVEFVANSTGSYRLDVSPRYPLLGGGKYVIRMVELRAASEQDKSLQEARNIYAESLSLYNTGKFSDALPLVERAIEIRKRELAADNPKIASAMTHLARIKDAQGDYDQAVQINQQVLTIREKILGANHPDVGYTLNYLGSNYIHQGDYQKAILFHQRALAVREKNFGSNHPIVAVSLINLGVVYDSLGDNLKARELYQRALKIQEQTVGTADRNTATLYNNLAKIDNDLDEYQEAQPLAERAVAILEKLVPPEHPLMLGTLTNLAISYLGQGNPQKAEPISLQVLQSFEKTSGPNHPDTAKAAQNLATIYASEDNFEKAESLYRRAAEIRENNFGPDSPSVSESLSGVALMCALKGEVEPALKMQQRANLIDERNISLGLAVGSERQKLAYLSKLFDQTNQSIFLQTRFAPDNALAVELAATTVLRQKGRVLDAVSNNLIQLRQHLDPQDRTLLDDLNKVTEQTAELILNGPDSVTLTEHQEKIQKLTDEREKLEDAISRRAAGFYSKSQPVNVSSVQSVIPRNSVLLEFAVYSPVSLGATNKPYDDPHYVVYVLRHDGEIKWKELGDVNSIDRTIEALRQALGDPQRKDVPQLARAVDEKIMQPVRALLGNATQLLISPDGALNLIPFEALVDEQNHYLIEKYSFSYLTSGRDLLRMQVARDSRTKPVVIANPSFGEPPPAEQSRVAKASGAADSGARRDKRRRSVTTARDLSGVYFAPLSGTAQEAHSIQGIFPEAVVLSGLQATKSALTQINAPSILHIATHGFFLQNTETDSHKDSETTKRGLGANGKIENPLLRSGLALAGANRHDRSGSAVGDGGILTALEASGLNLWGTKLVVLSACDTGLGEVRNGEGVYGLRRAFVLAGTESLVMSLWSVSDYITREIMTDYYKNLKAGMGRGEALREVQLQMLKRKGREHPFYWAGFIQSGEWANLDGKR